MAVPTYHYPQHVWWDTTGWHSTPYIHSGMYGAARSMTSTDGCGPPYFWTSSPFSVSPELAACHPCWYAGYFTAYNSTAYEPRYTYPVQLISTQAAGATRSLPWWTETEPPPHVRSMYESIPLPGDDIRGDEEQLMPITGRRAESVDSLASLGSLSSSSSSSLSSLSLSTPPTPPVGHVARTDPTRQPNTPYINQRAIELHPILQEASRSPKTFRRHAVTPKPGSPLAMDQRQVRNEPATIPSVGYLTLVVDSTGQTIGVHPLSFASPHIVTVGDVLNALDEALLAVENDGQDPPSQRDIPSPKRLTERVGRLMSSVSLWWKTSGGGGEATPKSWRLMVGRK